MCRTQSGATRAAVYLIFQALLVDMEEGVVHRLLRGPLKSLFDDTLLITDVSGAGNNWLGRLNATGRHSDMSGRPESSEPCFPRENLHALRAAVTAQGTRT